MKFIIFILTFLLLRPLAYSSDFKGKFTLIKAEERVLVAGDSFQAVLIIWPNASKLYNHLKNLKRKKILSDFFIYSVKKIKLSDNNKDVLEVHLKGVLLNDLILDTPRFLTISGIKIPVNIYKFQTAPSKLPTENYIILSQNKSFLSNIEKLLLVLLSIILLVVLIYITKLYWTKYRCKTLQKQREKFKKYWIEKFDSAKTRQSMEKIYLERQIWMKDLELKDSEIKDYFKIINQYQYKRDISKSELENVRNSLLKINLK